MRKPFYLMPSCRRPGSNRYDVLPSQDFKSCASASSATPATGDTQIRTGGEGFAVLCLTTWLCRRTERALRYNDIYYSREVEIRQSFFYRFFRFLLNNLHLPAPLSEKAPFFMNSLILFYYLDLTDSL